MAGASLIPDFYKEKVNLAVLLAPPASMKNNRVGFLNLLSLKINRQIIVALLETIHMYNLLPYNFLNTGVATLVCNLFDGKLCDLLMSLFADEDPTIDYTDRYDVYMSNLPSGAGYKNFLHYAQLIDQPQECFRRYDMGSEKANMAKYGQKYPPDYDMSLIDFPIAILAGQQDLLADAQDVAWTHQQLSAVTVFYHMYYLGHMSFAIAKDMSWFTVDTMAIVNHYNNKCHESTASSKFTIGNEKCKSNLFLY